MKARRFDFYPDDWIAGTVALAMDERGIYITAISLMYSHGGRVLKSELRRHCPCDLRVYNRALGGLVESGKLVVSGAYLSNKRVVSETQKARKRLLSSAQNGRKGGRPKNANNEIAQPNHNPDRKPDQNPPAPSPSPSPKEEDSEANASGADAPADPIAALWKRGLAIVGAGHRSLFGKLRKTYGDPTVLAAIVACETEHPSEPVAFLVACCERSKANGKGSAGHANALDTLGRAAVEFDERQNRGGVVEASH